jgi:hypothetical protein
MFTADQFASEEDEETGEIELSELEVEELDDDEETTEILEPTAPMVDVDDTDVLNNHDEESTMALVERDVSSFKRDDDSVSQDLDDVLHQNLSELEQAISQVPNIQFSNEKVADTDDRNFVYEEDSDESFLSDTKPVKHKEVFVFKEKKEIPQKNNQKKGIGLSLIGALIVVVAVVGGLWLANDKPIEVDKSTGQENLYVPNMPEVSKVEKQKAPEKSVNLSSKSTKKNNTSKPVQRGGVQTFQTAAPVSRAKSPTASASVSSSDQVEKDISKLRRNLKSCHDQALKIDPLASGKWRVQFKVNPSGNSSNISIKALRAKNSDIESCMSRRIGRFRFHGPSSTTPYDFRIVFGG